MARKSENYLEAKIVNAKKKFNYFYCKHFSLSLYYPSKRHTQ